MPETASPLVPYKPTRPPLLATAREFLLLFPRARDFWRMRHESADIGSGARGAVLVVPTLFCGDWQTVRLRDAIARAGYACYGWDLGTDWGPTPRLMRGVEARLLELAEAHGPVSLVGLSMGGLFCRWLALRHPGRVRQVITVCSPFRAPIDSFWLPLRPALKIWPVPGLAELAEDLQLPLPVPCASLFSKRDGIVARASCCDPARPEECFEIDASHVMIASDPSVVAIVLERLDAWQEGMTPLRPVRVQGDINDRRFRMASLDDTTNTSGRLIAAKQVQGATVFSTEMEKLGAIEDVMIDKGTGRIAYAILAHGGFLGIGDRYYPLPWEKLSYDTEMGGYVVDIGQDVLQGAPSYSDEAAASWQDDTWRRGIYSYYGVNPFWDLAP